MLKTEEGSSIFQGTFAKDDITLPPALVRSHEKRDRKNRRAKGYAEALEQILAQAKEFNIGASALVEKTQPGNGETEETDEPEEKQQGKEDEPEEMLRPCSMNDFTELAEALLCFHAWYKLGIIRKQPGGKVDRSLIHASVIRMLAMVRFYMPRKKGNGWKIQKFHDILHLALDIERFGPPSNYDAGPGESGLKIWTKLPALTLQKRGYNTFLRQVGSRVFKTQCISKALRSHGVKEALRLLWTEPSLHWRSRVSRRHARTGPPDLGALRTGFMRDAAIQKVTMNHSPFPRKFRSLRTRETRVVLMSTHRSRIFSAGSLSRIPR